MKMRPPPNANLKPWAPLRIYFEIRYWHSLPLSFHVTAVMRSEDREHRTVFIKCNCCAQMGTSLTAKRKVDYSSDDLTMI